MHIQSAWPLRRILSVLILLFTTLATSATPTTSHGTFSTSAYRVSWPDRWHSVGESPSNLTLSDGLTFIHAVGIFDTISPETSVPELVNDWFTNVIVAEDIVEIVPTTAASSERAFSIFTYRYRVSDQQLDPYAVYFEARVISPGLILWMVVDTHLGLYRADPDVFDSAVSSLQIEGQEATSPPRQSFASGPWHVSIPTVVLDESISSLGLSSVPNSRWVVVLTDIANAGSLANQFSIDSAVIESEDGSQFTPSSIDTLIVSSSLQLDDPLSATAAIQPGAQDRVALVYLIPEDVTDPSLIVGDQGLSIEALIDPELGVGVLPPRPKIPSLLYGTIESWSNRASIQVKLDDGASGEFVLLAANAPSLQGCYGPETDAFLQSLMGSRVAIERDPAVLSNEFVYIWIDDGIAAPALLNHRLIELGYASVVAIPEHARFEMWFGQTESVAQAEGRGRWAVCV